MAKMEDLQIITNLNSPPKMVLLNCKYDLMKMCRTCNKECTEASISLFKYLRSNTEQIQIAEMLTVSTTLKVELGDGLPMIICFDCMNELIKVYHFLKKCKETYASMRQYVFNDENGKCHDENTNPVDNNNPDLFYIKYDMDTQKTENTDTNGSTTKDTDSIFDNVDSVDNDNTYDRETDNDETIDYVETVEVDSELEAALGYEVEEVDIQDDLDKMIEEKKKEDMIKKWHDKVHRKKLMPCPHCTKCFQKEANLKDHIALHTGERSYHCEFCTKSYITRLKLAKHVREKHLQTPIVYKCKKGDCVETYSTYLELKAHIKTHVKNFWHCKECGQTFTYRKGFSRHRDMHAGIIHEGVTCNICGKTLADQSSLYSHQRRHKKNYTFICDICGKGLLTPKELKLHIKRNHRESGSSKDYICEVCGKELASLSSLANHRLAFHDRKPASVPCPLCPKKFLRVGQMRVHMKIHNKEYKFTCEVCDQKLFSLKELNIHKLKHTGERPFKCPKCPKTYTRPAMYNFHVQRHSKSLIQCDVCLFFLRPQYYEKHRAGHDNKKARDESKVEKVNVSAEVQES